MIHGLPYFFLSLSFAKRSSWSEPQLQVLFLLSVSRFSIFAGKEHNQSDFGIDHLVKSRYRVISWVVGKGCLLWPACSSDKIFAFSLLHFILQSQTCLLFWVSLDCLVLHSNPLWGKGHPFWPLVLEGVVGLHRISQLQLLWHCWGIDLDYCDVEWFALEMNQDHSVILRLHPWITFWIILLNMKVIPFLLRYSCPQWYI